MTLHFGDAGFLRINGSKAANYTFALESDDGSQLYIHGKLVVADPGASRCGGLAQADLSALRVLRRSLYFHKMRCVLGTGLGCCISPVCMGARECATGASA